MRKLEQPHDSINSDVYDATEGNEFFAYAVEELDSGKTLAVFQDKKETFSCANMAVNPTVGGYGDVVIKGQDSYSLPFFTTALAWLTS